MAVPNSRIPSEAYSAWTASSGQRPGYSSLAIREQAASLMNQIRSDVKSHKRMYSVDSNGSMVQNDARSLQSHFDDAAQDEPLLEGDTEIIDEGEIEPEPARRPSFSRSPLATSANQGSATNVLHTDSGLPNRFSQLTLSENRPFSRPPDAAPAPSLPPFTLAAPSGAGAPAGQTAFLSPLSAVASPAYPAGSLHGGRKEDMNRFVSSSTASGGTVTSGSAASFVKHQGPKHITHISPDDLPPLPDRVGRMVFDRNIMKWVKASSMELNGVVPSGTMRTDGSSESDDPFRDIESIRDDDAAPAAHHDAEAQDEDMSLDDSRADAGAADSGPEDEEEAELTSFSFDASAGDHATAPARAAGSQDGEDEDTVTSGQFMSISMLDGSFAGGAPPPHTAVQNAAQEPALEDTPPHLLAPAAAHASTPRPSAPGPAPTPIIRSALKSTSVTPVSVMKDTSRGRTQTPANKLAHRRSVSFSDGKRDGPIAGLGRNAPTPDDSVDTDPGSLSDSCASGTSNALIPSARSKRIADMLEGLEDTCEPYLRDPCVPSLIHASLLSV